MNDHPLSHMLLRTFPNVGQWYAGSSITNGAGSPANIFVFFKIIPEQIIAALPHGTGGTAADRKPPAHQHHQHHGQLSQSASLFPCVQKCIWHQPTGLSCKAFCTIKIGLILRYTPFVFPTYKNTPFVRPNTVGQMGCCSFRGALCFLFAFNLLTHGSRLRFSNIPPGHHSKSNQHSSAGHYR